MTQKEARELSLEVWRYLRDHPKIERKEDLPKDIWEKICFCRWLCPLCEIFQCCFGCPLKQCALIDSYYHIWNTANSDWDRKKGATGIVRRIDDWVPEGR